MAASPCKTSRKGKYEHEFRRIGVMLENINANITLLAEGQAGLQRQINHLDDKLEKLREEMNCKFETVFGELHTLDGRMTKLEQRFA